MVMIISHYIENKTNGVDLEARLVQTRLAPSESCEFINIYSPYRVNRDLKGLTMAPPKSVNSAYAHGINLETDFCYNSLRNNHCFQKAKEAVCSMKNCKDFLVCCLKQ